MYVCTHWTVTAAVSGHGKKCEDAFVVATCTTTTVAMRGGPLWYGEWGACG